LSLKYSFFLEKEAVDKPQVCLFEYSSGRHNVLPNKTIQITFLSSVGYLLTRAPGVIFWMGSRRMHFSTDCRIVQILYLCINLMGSFGMIVVNTL